jgi:ATP-binding cassette subfamily G (WHITE) protein 2 (SNQ2)
MVTGVIDGVGVTRRSTDLVSFEPPANMTCGTYAVTWAASARAQILDPVATGLCEVCPLTKGDQYLQRFYLGSKGMLSDKWMYWAVFFSFMVSNFELVYLCTWFGKVRGLAL